MLSKQNISRGSLPTTPPKFNIAPWKGTIPSGKYSSNHHFFRGYAAMSIFSGGINYWIDINYYILSSLSSRFAPVAVVRKSPCSEIDENRHLPTTGAFLLLVARSLALGMSWDHVVFTKKMVKGCPKLPEFSKVRNRKKKGPVVLGRTTQ